MRSSAKKLATVAAMALLGTGLSLSGGATVQADDQPADVASTTDFSTYVQDRKYDQNLDALYGSAQKAEVWTRDASAVYQKWRFTKVGQDSDGTIIYIIRPVVPPSPTGYDKNCITAAKTGTAVKQAPCNKSSHTLAQHWEVKKAGNSRIIRSLKHEDYVLQAHGKDTAVTLEHIDDDDDQKWSFYEK